MPYGVNCLWDPIASLDLAVATEAKFVREIFSGVYASDFGLWDTNCGEVVRHQREIGAENVKLMFNIVPEAGGFEGLFTGDIGTETEKKLLPELEDVDFLKVGHHGSRYSTCQEFLDVVRPELAVVSCSATNTYGHPSGETIERLEDSGAKIWYTMKEGAVTAETDGKEVWVDTFVHP